MIDYVRTLRFVMENGAFKFVPMMTASRLAVHLELKEEFEYAAQQQTFLNVPEGWAEAVRKVKIIMENGAYVFVPMTMAARYALHLELMEEFENLPQRQQQTANFLKVLVD